MSLPKAPIGSQFSRRVSLLISLAVVLTASSGWQEFGYQNSVYADSSYLLSVKDFALRYEEGPAFGRIVVGKPLIVSALLQNDASMQTNGTYLIQFLDRSGYAIDIQSKIFDISNPAPTEITASWIPRVPGSYTISGFVWSMSNESTLAIAPSTSLIVNVEPAPEFETYTLCTTGCDYADFQKAIDHVHNPENKILVKDGTYEVSRPINVWSHTSLEFSPNATIIYTGPQNNSVFRANSATDIEIINAQIKAESTPGIKAFSFTASKRVNITGGEVSLRKGGESTGFYCRDCTNVALIGMNIVNASRLVDIGTSSEKNDGKSSKIWVMNGNYQSSSIEGIKVNYSDKVYIIGNNVSDTSNNAIDIGYSSNALVSDNRIENGGVPDGSGIHTDSAVVADIFGNVVKGTGKAGITVYRASDISIINNTITDAGSFGIAVLTSAGPSSNIQVKNNNVRDSSDAWLYVSPNQSNVQLAGNIVDRPLDGNENVSEAFTIVLIPDTQNYWSTGNEEIAYNQSRWIVNNKDRLNIEIVIHLGDIVNTSNNEAQWLKADTMMKILDDDKVPYLALVGNHDVGNPYSSTSDRNYKLFERYFPHSRLIGDQTLQSEEITPNGANMYTYLTVDENELLILSMEYCPTLDVIEQVNEVIRENDDKRIILATHAFLRSNGEWTSVTGGGVCTKIPGTDDYSTQAIWDLVVYPNPNVFLVVSGHSSGDNKRIDNNVEGNPVQQVVIDYQNRKNGGDGMLKIITFYPEEDKINFETYSPWFDSFGSSARSKYNFDYDMN